MAEMTVTNPLTRETLYTLDSATDTEVDAAFDNARAASARLHETSVTDRLDAIRKLVNWLQTEREWLLDRIVAESGRCRTDAMISDLFQLTEDCEWLLDHAGKVLRDQKVSTPVTLLGKQFGAVLSDFSRAGRSPAGIPVQGPGWACWVACWPGSPAVAPGNGSG